VEVRGRGTHVVTDVGVATYTAAAWRIRRAPGSSFFPGVDAKRPPEGGRFTRHWSGISPRPLARGRRRSPLDIVPDRTPVVPDAINDPAEAGPLRTIPHPPPGVGANGGGGQGLELREGRPGIPTPIHHMLDGCAVTLPTSLFRSQPKSCALQPLFSRGFGPERETARCSAALERQ